MLSSGNGLSDFEHVLGSQIFLSFFAMTSVGIEAYKAMMVRPNHPINGIFAGMVQSGGKGGGGVASRPGAVVERIRECRIG